VNICVVPGVLKTLQLTVHEREWMKGIVLSAAYLEAYALGKLKDFFMVAGRKPFDEELEKLNFNQITVMMLALNLIDERTCREMQKVKKTRNRLIRHRVLIPKLHQRKCLHLIEDTIHILERWGAA